MAQAANTARDQTYNFCTVPELSTLDILYIQSSTGAQQLQALDTVTVQ